MIEATFGGKRHQTIERAEKEMQTGRDQLTPASGKMVFCVICNNMEAWIGHSEQCVQSPITGVWPG